MPAIVRRRGLLLALLLITATACSTRGCGSATSTGAAAQPGTTASAAPPPTAAAPALPAADDKTIADAAAFIARSAAAPSPDVEKTAADLGDNPSAIFTFVHDHVRTEIYRGILRGAGGTLSGGAGNAWDQALLAAALLRHHHREVRFAHAHLAPDAAAKIVDRMFTDAARPRPPRPAATASDALQQQGRSWLGRVDEDARRAGADLLDAVDRAHVVLGSGAATDQVLASEAGDHLFVEYRDGDNWIAFDPAGAAAPGASAGPAEERFADVPDSAYHHVTIHVWIEQRRNGALDRQEVLRYPATAVELNGASLVLQHRFDRDLAGRWRATPVLQAGGKSYAARGFNEQGILGAKANSKEDLIGQAHDAVGGLGAVTDAFGGGKAAPAAPASAELTAEWLEFEFTDPAKQAVVVRRDLVDRIGIVARANGSAATGALAPLPLGTDVPLPFAGVYACAFASGPLDPGLSMRQVSSAAGLLGDLQALRRVSAAANGQLAPDDHQRFARVVAALPAMLAAAAENALVTSQRLAARSPAQGTPLFYEATPRMVIASFDPLAGGALDLRRNTVRAAGRQMPGPALARASLSRAASDAAIERALIGAAGTTSAGGARLAAIDVFDRARAEGIRFVAGQSGAAPAAVQPTDIARARMTLAESGRVLIAPERTPSAAPPRFAWWQVDPSTGDAVTVLDTGLYGAQDMPEYGATNAISPMAYEVPPPSPISPLAYEVGPPRVISPLAYNVPAPWAQCVEFTGDMLLELIRALTATGNL